MTEPERQARHEAYLQWTKALKKEGACPAPGYKDCYNCPIREDYEPEDRAEFCTTSCPYDDLPTHAPTPYLLAELWADLPDVFLADHARGIGLRMCLEVSRIKKHREDKRMAALMGAKLLG